MYPHGAPSFERSVILSTHGATAQHGRSKQVVHGLCVRLLGMGMWSGPGLGIDELTTIPCTAQRGSLSSVLGFNTITACGAAIRPYNGGQSLTQ